MYVTIMFHSGVTPIPHSIIDELHDKMEEPDIITLLFSAIKQTFSQRFPGADITLHATEEPDQIHVTVTPKSPITYTMGMTDSWEDQPDFRFIFTNTTDPKDTITVDLAAP